jgi:hypothetical protein
VEISEAKRFLGNFPIEPKKVYSQTGEEGILQYIFENIGTTNKFLVDFGAGDGIWLSNSKLLLDEHEFVGLRMDGNGTNDVKKEFITRENILELFEKYEVPTDLDLLSIDIDGNDYWVLKEILTKHKPRVIVAEFNGCLPVGVSQTIAYNPSHTYQSNDYYGASFEAIKRLCKDYVVVHESTNLNMFLIHKDIIGDIEPNVPHAQTQYHPHFAGGDWVLNPENL